MNESEIKQLATNDEINSLEQFKIKLKDVLIESEEDYELRFENFNKYLCRICPDGLDKLNSDKNFLLLLNDFYQLIRDEKQEDYKSELFVDLVKELTAHLLKKPEIHIPVEAIEPRKKRIRKIKKEIFRLNKKIKRYENKELSFEDIDKEEDNVLEKIHRFKKNLVQKFKKLRELENKRVYFGEDEINFNEITNNPQLNQILSREILSKFKEHKSLPDYSEIFEILDKFSKENYIQLDYQAIFKKICNILKEYRLRETTFVLNSYLNFEVPLPEESEALKQKLDQQNTFKKDLDEIAKAFVDKFKNEPQINEEDEETEDSESDASSECEDEMESISDNEDEFISNYAEENSNQELNLDEPTTSFKTSNMKLSNKGDILNENCESKLSQTVSDKFKKEDEIELIETKLKELKNDNISIKRKLDDDDQSSKRIKEEDCIVLD